MTYLKERGGRISGEGSGGGRVASEDSGWSYDGVEARLVEAVRCWWRMPGGGRWPFAGDGPWHLIRKAWEDWDAREPKPIRALPLRRAEISAMEEATEWLLLVADEGQRRALVAGLLERAKGRKRVGWEGLREMLGEPGLSGAAIEYRYSRAVGFIAMVLNARAGLPYAPDGARRRYPKAVTEAAALGKAKDFKVE